MNIKLDDIFDFSQLIYALNAENLDEAFKLSVSFLKKKFPSLKKTLFLFRLKDFKKYYSKLNGNGLSQKEIDELMIVFRNFFPDFKNNCIDIAVIDKYTGPAFYVPVTSNQLVIGIAALYFDKSIPEEEIYEITSILIDVGNILYGKICIFEKEKKYKNVEIEYNREMETALLLNKKIIPPPFFDFNNLEVKVIYKPYRIIGGDYYNCFKTRDGKYFVVLADAAGKGMAGAYISTMLHVILKYIVTTTDSFNLENVIKNINNFLCGSIDSYHFIAAVFLLIDYDENKISYINCGNFEPVFIGKNFDSSIKSYPPLGIGMFDSINSVNFSINNLEKILLFTDGVIEDPEMYEKVSQICNEFSYLSIDNILNLVYSKFNSGNCADDVTIVAVYLKPGISDSNE